MLKINDFQKFYFQSAMIFYSIIKKSQLEGALRLDAEYYQPEYLELSSKLKGQESKPLLNFLKLLYR